MNRVEIILAIIAALIVLSVTHLIAYARGVTRGRRHLKTMLARAGSRLADEL